ncbi:MAG: TatD family hydrolase [archaeon]
MKLIDVHCHLDAYTFPDVSEVIERCRKNNVLAFAAGLDPVTNKQVLALQETYPDVIYPCLGLYPRDALKKETENTDEKLDLDYDPDEVLKFIEEHKTRIIAVGEVGMDFKNGTDFKEQERVFRNVVALAIKINKPLIVHSRKAEKEVIDILEEFNYKKIVMHCFCGSHKLVRRIRENNWYFSIPTSIVRDEHFQMIVKETPLSLLLTETDSPFLSPFKDQRNEPSFVIETIKVIAKLKSLTEEDVATLLYRNCQYLFGIK